MGQFSMCNTIWKGGSCRLCASAEICVRYVQGKMAGTPHRSWQTGTAGMMSAEAQLEARLLRETMARAWLDPGNEAAWTCWQGELPAGRRAVEMGISSSRCWGDGEGKARGVGAFYDSSCRTLESNLSTNADPMELKMK